MKFKVEAGHLDAIGTQPADRLFQCESFHPGTVHAVRHLPNRLPDLLKHFQRNLFGGSFREFLVFKVTRQTGEFLASQIMKVFPDFGSFLVLGLDYLLSGRQQGSIVTQPAPLQSPQEEKNDDCRADLLSDRRCQVACGHSGTALG